MESGACSAALSQRAARRVLSEACALRAKEGGQLTRPAPQMADMMSRFHDYFKQECAFHSYARPWLHARLI